MMNYDAMVCLNSGKSLKFALKVSVKNVKTVSFKQVKYFRYHCDALPPQGHHLLPAEDQALEELREASRL